jgi:predicted nucleic acid-binding protein
MAKKKKGKKKRREAFVLDASLALAWCFSDEADPYADAIAKKFPDIEALVPTLWHLEIANVLLVGERKDRCDQADTATWTTFLATLPITVDEQTSTRAFGDILTLARTHNLSVYDAAYLELALRRRLPLASLDAPLQAAATAAGVALYAP